jgi:hypothetical protein
MSTPRDSGSAAAGVASAAASSSNKIMDVLKGEKATEEKLNEVLVDNPGGGSCAFYAAGIGLIPHFRQDAKSDILAKLLGVMKLSPAEEHHIRNRIKDYNFNVGYSQQDTKLLEFFNDGLRKILYADRCKKADEILQEMAVSKVLSKDLFKKDEELEKAWELFTEYYFGHTIPPDAPMREAALFQNTDLNNAIKEVAKQLQTQHKLDIEKLTKQAKEDISKKPPFDKLDGASKQRRLMEQWKSSEESKAISLAFLKFICSHPSSISAKSTLAAQSPYQRFLQVKQDMKEGAINKAGWGDSGDIKRLAHILNVGYTEKFKLGNDVIDSSVVTPPRDRPTVYLNQGFRAAGSSTGLRGWIAKQTNMTHWSTVLDVKDALRLNEKTQEAFVVDPTLAAKYAHSPTLTLEEIKAVFADYGSSFSRTHHTAFAKSIVQQCGELGETPATILHYIENHLPKMDVTGTLFSRINYLLERSRVSLQQQLVWEVSLLDTDIKKLETIGSQWELGQVRARDVVNTALLGKQNGVELKFAAYFNELKTHMKAEPFDSAKAADALRKFGNEVNRVGGEIELAQQTGYVPILNVLLSLQKTCEAMENRMGLQPPPASPSPSISSRSPPR